MSGLFLESACELIGQHARRGRKREFPKAARSALIWIAKFMDEARGIAWPSVGTLADMAGCSRRTMFRAFRILEALGLLERIRTRRGRRQGTNIYRSAVLAGRVRARRARIRAAQARLLSERGGGGRAVNPAEASAVLSDFLRNLQGDKLAQKESQENIREKPRELAGWQLRAQREGIMK